MVTRNSIGTWSIAVVVLVCAGASRGQEAAPDAKSNSNDDAMTVVSLDETESKSVQPATTSTDEEIRTPAPISADDILKEFQRERPTAEPLLPDPPPGETIIRENADDGSMGESFDSATAGSRARLPDGYILVDRSGRLHREGEWWVISYVSDNHPDSMPEPPMKLLPNRMLERMVRESEATGNNVEFIVSGEVTDFLGENYLLLRKLMRKRDMGNLSH